MEYKLVKILGKYRLPLFLRLFFGTFFILCSIIAMIIPILGTFFIGLALLVLGILVINPKKVKEVVKLRKSLLYLCANITNKKIIWFKIYDIKKTCKNIVTH